MSIYNEPNQELEGDIVPADIPDSRGFVGQDAFDHFSTGPIDTLDTPTGETDIPHQKDRKERLTDIHERFHFYPSSFRELNDAVLLDSDDSHQDVVGFLATVFNHQAINYTKKQTLEGIRTEDPKAKMDTIAAAVRAILSRYADYGSDARANAGFSIELAHLLLRADLNANEPIERAVKDIYPDSEAVWRPLINLMRLHESIEFVEKDAEEHVNDPYYHANDPNLQLRLAEFVKSLSSRKAFKLITADVKQQEARAAYWAEKLTQATHHGNKTVRAIANTGLRKLGIHQPE